MAEPRKNYLTARELEDWVPMSLNTIRKWTREGFLPYKKVGPGDNPTMVVYDWNKIKPLLEQDRMEHEEDRDEG